MPPTDPTHRSAHRRHPRDTNATHRAPRILLVRPSALGDVCRTVPVLASLRAAHPEAHIAWLVQRGFEDAIRHHPALDEVIPFDRKRMAVKRLWTPDGSRALLALLRDLRGRRFDIAIDCQGLSRSAFFARASGAPIRVGPRDARELGWIAYNRRVRPGLSEHTVDRMLDLLTGIDVPPVRDMRLYPSDDDRSWARKRCPPAGVVLSPTSRWPGKRWPIDRFVGLAEALLADGREIVVVGGPGERGQCGPLLERFAGDARVIDLVGSTTVGQMMAVIAGASLVIACDSAAMHMAVGLARPLVGLFGPTQIERVGPYQRASDVLRSSTTNPHITHKDADAGAEVMRTIPLDAVIDAARVRLGDPQDRRE